MDAEIEFCLNCDKDASYCETCNGMQTVMRRSQRARKSEAEMDRIKGEAVLLVEKGMTYRDIGKRLGVSDTSVLAWARRAGVVKPKHPRKKRED